MLQILLGSFKKIVRNPHPYLKNVASNPHLVTGGNADGRANLELPLKPTKSVCHGQEVDSFRIQNKLGSVVVFHLSWHDLPVDATDVDASIQASLVVGVNYVAPERLVSADTAVKRTLNIGD